MTLTAAATTVPTPAAIPQSASPARSGMALYALLGFSAGLPFYMFSTVLVLRLQAHSTPLAIIGFFAWVQLLPTFKFLWAPLLDRYDVPGFARFWGKRRGWIMLAQLGIFSAMLAMAATAGDANLAVTALFAVLLAFWTTTLEIAADAWRIELYPTQEQQGPIVAANLWGYRSAMVAAGSGALILADWSGWAVAYLAIALVSLLPFPILALQRAQKAPSASREEVGGGGSLTRPSRALAGAAEVSRLAALAGGLLASAVILSATGGATALLGWAVLALAKSAGIGAESNVTPVVLALCMLPFLAMAAALPKIRRAPPDSRLRTSTALGPYVDFFWRYGTASILLMAFVSLYRMGDVLALNLSKPMIRDLGYTLTQIGRADGAVALLSSIAGVALGGWLVTRWRIGGTLALGALFAGIGNLGFVWLAHQPLGEWALYLATGLDQFGNGMAGAVFVVYLSLLVNPRYPGAQFAFLTGFAFLLPRLLAGAGGQMVEAIGYDGFFLLSGVLSLAAILFLPALARIRPRPAEDAA